jgi:hypothetical protein
MTLLQSSTSLILFRFNQAKHVVDVAAPNVLQAVALYAVRVVVPCAVRALPLPWLAQGWLALRPSLA